MYTYIGVSLDRILEIIRPGASNALRRQAPLVQIIFALMRSICNDIRERAIRSLRKKLRLAFNRISKPLDQQRFFRK